MKTKADESCLPCFLPLGETNWIQTFLNGTCGKINVTTRTEFKLVMLITNSGSHSYSTHTFAYKEVSNKVWNFVNGDYEVNADELTTHMKRKKNEAEES